jgi:hypothetical protein
MDYLTQVRYGLLLSGVSQMIVPLDQPSTDSTLSIGLGSHYFGIEPLADPLCSFWFFDPTPDRHSGFPSLCKGVHHVTNSQCENLRK